MVLRFQLCASMDTPEKPLLDDEKIPRLKQLEQTCQYYFEPKLDGTRGGLGKTADGAVTIPNRRELDYARFHNLPELEAIAKIFPPDTMLDGEIVVTASAENCEHKTCKCKVGHPCRLLAQRRCGTKTSVTQSLIEKLPVIFIAWDITRLAGENLMNEPLWKRRKILSDFVAFAHAGAHNLVLIKQWEQDAEKLFMSEPEGIIAKLKTSIYLPMEEGGSRLAYWIKIKHTFLEVFSVAGYCLEAQGRLSGQMRNLVITDENGEYKGTVGGGFSDQERREVKAFLDSQPSAAAPYSLSSKVKHQFLYKPNTGLKLLACFQETMPSKVIFQPRMIELIYPTIRRT